MFRLFTAILFLSLFGSSTVRADPSSIEWGLENPFRLFKNPEFFKLHYGAYLSIKNNSDQAKTPILSAERYLSQKSVIELDYSLACLKKVPLSDTENIVKCMQSPDKDYKISRKGNYYNLYPDKQLGWAFRVFEKTCWNRKDHDYSFNQNVSQGCKNYIDPNTYDIWLKFKDDNEADITWSCTYSDTTGIKQCRCNQSSTERPYATCSVPAATKVTITAQREGQPPASRQIDPIQDKLIVGLGDSFASGEGNPDKPMLIDDKRTPLRYEEFIGKKGQTPAGLQRLYPARTGNWRVKNVEPSGWSKLKAWFLAGKIYPANNMAEKIIEDETAHNVGGEVFSGQVLSGSTFLGNRAFWWDMTCHRSLYSHQLRAALQIAIENPQQAVTFISLACSGAQVSHGILQDKEFSECYPKVYWRQTEASKSRASRIVSQISALQKALKGENGSKKRKIDLLLLSIGGNDVGFSDLVRDAITKDNFIKDRLAGMVPDLDSTSVDKVMRTKGKGGDLAVFEKLALAYDDLKAALKNVGIEKRIEGNKKRDNIIVTAYPSMAYDQHGALCKAADSPLWMGVIPKFKTNLSELQTLEETIMPKMYQKMKQQITGKFGWSLVDQHRIGQNSPLSFKTHGICALKSTAPATDINKSCLQWNDTEQISFPWKLGKKWCNFNPNSYKPYASRQRWYRTPNDTFLTSNTHAVAIADTNCGRDTKSGWQNRIGAWLMNAKTDMRNTLQVYFAATYGGAFHPTAEGQAAMADAVLVRANCILEDEENNKNCTN